MNQQAFSTGAVRDVDKGKPDFTRIPYWVWIWVAKLLGGELRVNRRGSLKVDPPTGYGNIEQVSPTLLIIKGRFKNLMPLNCLKRVQAHLEKGAEHYGENNWQKGIPLHRTLASLFRHLLQWMLGDRSEDHLAAVIVNAMFLMETERKIFLEELPREVNGERLDTAGSLNFQRKVDENDATYVHLA